MGQRSSRSPFLSILFRALLAVQFTLGGWSTQASTLTYSVIQRPRPVVPLNQRSVDPPSLRNIDPRSDTPRLEQRRELNDSVKPTMPAGVGHQDLTFIENQGQWDPGTRYRATSGALTIWVTDNGLIFDT